MYKSISEKVLGVVGLTSISILDNFLIAITAILRYQYGIVINHKTANKLMKEPNLKVPIKKVKYHS